jgi:hypothetical protein
MMDRIRKIITVIAIPACIVLLACGNKGKALRWVKGSASIVDAPPIYHSDSDASFGGMVASRKEAPIGSIPHPATQPTILPHIHPFIHLINLHPSYHS